jgi:hypothetical protein
MDQVVGVDTKICSLHFRPSDFVDAAKRKLKPDAVPIVNKYSFYFNIAVPKKKMYNKSAQLICFICSILKLWKVQLKNPTNEVPKLFA